MLTASIAPVALVTISRSAIMRRSARMRASSRRPNVVPGSICTVCNLFTDAVICGPGHSIDHLDAFGSVPGDQLKAILGFLSLGAFSQLASKLGSVHLRPKRV